MGYTGRVLKPSSILSLPSVQPVHEIGERVLRANSKVGVMRVLLVTETGEIGGAEINLLTIATELHDQGWEVAAVVPAEGPLTRRLRQAGVPVVVVARLPFLSTSLEFRSNRKIPNFFSLPINALVGLLWAVKLYAIFHQRRPCIVHTVSMWTHVFAGLAGRLAGCWVVWHFQDIVSPQAGWGLYRWMVLQAARYLPVQILSVSQKVAEQFQCDRLGSQKVRVLENTVDVARFQQVHRQMHRDSDGFTIGTVARFTPWKGHEVALQAARILQTRGVPFRWLFAGDDSLGDRTYRRYLQALVERWGLGHVVSFVGWVGDIAHFYGKLDVLVHIPVEPEPFGLVLAEAMAAGLPIVVTEGGGAETIVMDAGGLLVPSRQPEAVAKGIMTFIQNPQEALRRGWMARRYAEEHFDLGAYISRLVEAYGELEQDRR